VADYDPNQELNPKMIVGAGAVLVILAFSVVAFILFGT